MRALRVIVADVRDCYAALSLRARALSRRCRSEFDDYIAKPKANGYQSLHTVVRRRRPTADRGPDPHAGDARARRARRGRALGLQGGGRKGYAGVSAAGGSSTIAKARKAVLRQLLAWERDLVGAGSTDGAVFDDRIYVLTPQAAIVELPQGATPVDFAYTRAHRASATAAAARASTARWCR